MPNSRVLFEGRPWREAKFPIERSMNLSAPTAVDVDEHAPIGVYSSQSIRLSRTYILVCILVFIEVGRPFDQFLAGYHIPAIICSLGIIVTLFTNGLGALKSKTGIALLLFVVVMAVTTVTSIWRGGSFSYLLTFVGLNVVLFCLVASAPKSIAQVRGLIWILVLSMLFNVLAGTGVDSGGRLYLTDQMFGNSDDVGLMGGFSIPLVILLCSRLKRFLGLILGTAGCLGCLIIIGLSATRFAFLSLTVTAVVYFIRARAFQRMLLIFALVFALGTAVVFLPKSSIQRFSTLSEIFSGGPQNNGSSLSEADSSFLDRQLLAEDAMAAFIAHPIFGVGPDNFIVWRWEYLGRRGMRPHDVYLQTAAEEGIVGVILYATFLLQSLRTLQRSTKAMPGWEEGQTIALALQLSMVYFCVSGLFINVQMHAHQFIIAGLSVALLRFRDEYKAATAIVVT
jgi:O-antigen ligase